MENIKRHDLTFWISIISPIVYIAVAWAILSTNVTNQQKQIDDLQKTVSSHREDDLSRFQRLDNTYNQIQVQLAEIQRDIVYIKEKIK